MPYVYLPGLITNKGQKYKQVTNQMMSKGRKLKESDNDSLGKRTQKLGENRQSSMLKWEEGGCTGAMTPFFDIVRWI